MTELIFIFVVFSLVSSFQNWPEMLDRDILVKFVSRETVTT